MKKNRIKAIQHKYYDRFPTTSVIPKKGDIWLAKFPYETEGNMVKLRPVLVSHVLEDKFICRKFTTNSKKGAPVGQFYEKVFDKPTYITKIYKKITIDKFYKRIYASKEI